MNMQYINIHALLHMHHLAKKSPDYIFNTFAMMVSTTNMLQNKISVLWGERLTSKTVNRTKQIHT